ncbi:amino acid ABC transporter permease [Lentilactobacillus laojiaonis]|uniref:amino acid ABC transporter permease n=1 Tax=Lentilactobacillus laojiaonis TaxID=2883998 RepID=UPI001D09DC30|nr:amino acid ABC transporter permease [Lentilactobacillus laojiaonis]UDM31726.1 amino acid ABC transporter permease [Lentilactobacillus laojiaonis]
MLNYIQQILPALLGGTKVTLSIFAITLIIAIPLGILLGVTLTSKFKPIKWLLNTYILIMRGTPLLLQLIFIFYGLPLLGIVFSRYNAALIAFILNYAAYFSEIFRGGFQSIPKGQIESAKLLRLSKWQTLRYVLAPQVFKIVLPSVGNETINLIKDSSLVYVIGIGDLLRAGNVATARDVTLLPLILVGIIYLILTAITTYILKAIEKRTNVWR